MKNKIIFLSFSLIGFLGLAQQTTNEQIDKRMENGNIMLEQSISISIDEHVLVINEIDKNIFTNNTHELRHDIFKVDENQMDFNIGIYTLNDYAYNYKGETLTFIEGQS